MLNNNHSAGSPDEWLRYAHSDIEIARVTPSPEMLLESLCFHAQQTAHDFRNPPQESENQTEEGCEDESEGQEINGDYHRSNYQ